MKTREISIDQLTPVAAYAALAQQGSCLLESAFEKGEGRYSYIGIDPIATFTAKNGLCETRIASHRTQEQKDPFEALRAFFNQVRVVIDHPLASYSGGIVGFVTYDGVRAKEKISDRHPDPFALPDFFFQSYRSSLVFDHARGKALFVSESEEAIDALIEQLMQSPPLPMLGKPREVSIETDLSDAEFGAIVKRAQEHILAGDIFQIVLSRTFKVPIAADPFLVYRALRSISPVPYLFFFQLKDFAIVGASPEQLISVQKGIIESNPIAGTRPQGSDVQELLHDPKEVAEHVMLVDLARNDVGAVSIPGSVKVIEYKKVQEFSHVTHIVSRIVGTLDPKFDALEAFKFSFPAGTLSGAPKVRAMDLIDPLECSRRGLYGGAIVSLDGAGNLSSCIAIRTAFIKDNVAQVRAGAGIVLDSQPQKEAQETFHKAKAVLDALRLAAGGAP